MTTTPKTKTKQTAQTAYPAKTNVVRKMHTLDATDKVFGRLASEVASLLRGKGKLYFKAHLDVGDFVEVTNIEKLKFTGTKLETKMMYRHSGYPGGLKEQSLGTSFTNNPDRTFRNAVRGMLPKNRLSKGWLKRLTIK